MKSLLYFGEEVKGYTVRVLNEREVRAASGILFLFAFLSFMNAWFTGNFMMMKIFIIIFLIDFIIRVFLNPKFSPTLIMAKLLVRKQSVEYTGAAQKRFAWAVGFVLAVSMFFLLVINNIVGPINMFFCLICLTFLFFESALGICIGCKLYNFIKKDPAQLCPGGACEKHKTEEIQKVSSSQAFIMALLIIMIITAGVYSIVLPIFQTNKVMDKPIDITNQSVDDDCVVPDWAIAIGHEEQWKLHNGCN